MVRTSGRPLSFGRVLLCALALACSTSTLLAHTVPVEQRVDVDARIEQRSLLVHMHIPIDALLGAGLPRTLDGRLSPDATSGQVDTVAADAIRNLDIRGEQALRPMQVSSTPSPDRLALEIDATFRTPTLDGIDARLNAFQSDPLRPVVTTLHVHREDGRTLDTRVDGLATRVALDPAPADVLAQFAALAAHVVIGWGDQILVVLCLLAIPLAAGEAARRIGTLLVGQLAGMMLFAVAGGVLIGWTPAMVLIAASMVVIAGLQTALSAKSSGVTPLVLAFGLLNGAVLATSLSAELQFAGTHRGVAILAFTMFALVAETWISAIAFAGRRWLADRTVRERLVAYGVAAFAVHTALHRFADAGAALAGSASFAATHALVLTTIAWAVVILVVAAAEALRRAHHPRLEPAPMSGRP